MTGWADFFIATVGASAALSGTLLVAMSINIARIVGQPSLPGRAANTLIIIGTALMVSAIELMPIPLAKVGAVTALFGLLLLTSTAHVIRIVTKHRAAGPGLPRIILGMAGPMLAPLPYVAGGTMLTAGHPQGVSFISIGVLVGLVVSLLNSWVLLVEILR